MGPWAAINSTARVASPARSRDWDRMSGWALSAMANVTICETRNAGVCGSVWWPWIPGAGQLSGLVSCVVVDDVTLIQG